MTFKHWLEERGIHWWWQNLSDAPGRERHGFWHGRARLWFGGRRSTGIEWVHGDIDAAITARLDQSEGKVQFHVAVPGIKYFVDYEGIPSSVFNRLPMKVGECYGYEREVGLRVHDGKLWWSLWRDPMYWSSRNPKWMEGSLDVVKILLGETNYKRTTIEERDVSIPMPEKAYPAKAKLEVATWIRPRWPWGPFSKHGTYVSVDIPGGIGIPGKGENDWDIGDDALFGLSAKARTIEDGIGQVVASALATRRRHGWSPNREVSP